MYSLPVSFIPAISGDATTELITSRQQATMDSATIEPATTMGSATVQLPVGVIAGAAVGGGGAVILAAVQCRRKNNMSLEANPNQAYGVHNPTMKATKEDKHHDSVDLKDITPTEILVLPSNNISKQAEDALYEDMQADAANTEPTTEDNVGMASAVFTGHVTVSPNQAYGVTSIKKNDENEYEDTGPHL